MENLRISFEIIMPLFLYMLTGYIAKKRGLLTKNLNDGINQLMFAMFLPVLMFNTLYKDDLSGFGRAAFIPYAMGCTVLSFLLLFTLFTWLEKNPAKRGALIQGAFRGNSILYGLPIAISIFGEGNTAEIAVVLAAIIPIYNVLSVLVLEICGQAAATGDPRVKISLGSVNWKNVIAGICKNPLIHAVVLGIRQCLRHRLSCLRGKTMSGIAGVVTPMAFVMLGAASSTCSLLWKTGVPYYAPL